MAQWDNKDGRIRGRKLQDIRRRHFARHPLCVMCEAQGIVQLAQELDHITALANKGADVAENRQGLCLEHHQAKTLQDLGYQERPTFDRSGRVVWSGPT